MSIEWMCCPEKGDLRQEFYAGVRWAIVCCLVVTWTVAAGPAFAGYEELAKKLETNGTPDSTVVDSLPEPTTARQHWLYGRVVRNFESSINHLQQAVTGATSEERREKYFMTWMRQALLGARSYSDFLRRHVERFSDRRSVSSAEFWLLAGRLADLWEMNELARKCYRTVLKQKPSSSTARLKLARLALAKGDYSRTENLLEEYFLDSDTAHRSLYWLLRGRLFEARSADSEAYIAYSHIINNYPRSLLLKRAETEISGLSLPKALYARNSGSTSQEEPETTAPEEPTAETGTTRYYRVQVGSFRKRQRAQSLRRRLEKVTEVPVVIQEARVEGNLYYRVKAGRKRSLPPARDLLEKLRQQGFQGFVTKDK